MSTSEHTARLEELRAVIRAERISYGELFELQSLAEYIEPGDVELLEWAGVPEEVAFFPTCTSCRNRHAPDVECKDNTETEEETTR